MGFKTRLVMSLLGGFIREPQTPVVINVQQSRVYQLYHGNTNCGGPGGNGDVLQKLGAGTAYRKQEVYESDEEEEDKEEEEEEEEEEDDDDEEEESGVGVLQKLGARHAAYGHAAAYRKQEVYESEEEEDDDDDEEEEETASHHQSWRASQEYIYPTRIPAPLQDVLAD